MIDVVGTLYLYARNDLLSKPEVHSITNIDDLAGNIYSENSWIREIKQVGILHDPVYWVDCYGGYFDRQVSCWRECIRSIRNDEGPAFSFERPCCHILWRFSLRRHHMFVEMPFNFGEGRWMRLSLVLSFMHPCTCAEVMTETELGKGRPTPF